MRVSLRGYRWLVALAVSLALVGGLAACGGDDSSSSGSGSGATASADKEKVKLAFIQLLAGGTFFENQADGARSAAEVDGAVDLTVAAPARVNPQEEATQLQNAIAAGAKGVAIMAVPPTLFAKPLKAAIDSGIKGVSVTVPQFPDSGVETYVGADDFTAGMKGAAVITQRIAEESGKDTTGTIVTSLCDEGTVTLDARVAGYKAQIEKDLPNVEIKGPFVTGADPATSLAQWQSVVSANPDALAFLGSCNVDGPALAKVKEATGGAWLAGAFETEPGTIDGVRDGLLAFTVDSLEWVRAYVGITLLADAVRGTKELPKGWIEVQPQVVTQDNVEEVAARVEATGQERIDLYKPFVDEALAAAPKPFPPPPE